MSKTIDWNEFVAAFGQPFESITLQSLVALVGSTQVPRAKPDDPGDYVQNKRAGIELMFMDADFMRPQPVARYGNAPMLLVATTLYTGRQAEPKDFRSFTGTLPGGATFADSPEQLEAKLGPPQFIDDEDGVVYNRSWVREGYRLGFNYADTGVLKFVQLVWPTYWARI